jgi:4-diphosphocytidyl-2-C-methyl-D-erythritol kinase
MICFPNAKINLGLRIIEKRPDGYHNLETVFYPIGLKDALEIVPNTHHSDFSLSVSGLRSIDYIGNTEKNLVTKAFRLLQSNYSLSPADFYLYKTIPSGAGLGGGSSDAAFALKIINKINNLSLSDYELEDFSAHLGADCSFFIKNKPTFATGIGTVFEDISLHLKGYYLILVKPNIHVSTAEAYSQVHPAYPESSLKDVLTDPVSTWKNTVVNDFEASVFNLYPEIKSIKEQMYLNGAEYASMSGSGSSVFGLFSEPVDLRSSFRDCFYWSETLD